MKHFILPWYTTILSVACFSQSNNYKPKLDSFFNQVAVHNKAMGSLAIAKNGQLQYSKTFGYSLYNNDQKIPTTKNSIYRTGSISKIFTAVIIFQLIEEGKITLATTLETYFPRFPYASEITVSHLLNHRSGIRNMTEVASKEKSRTHEEMLAIITQRPPKYKPGVKSYYSNCNFLLLGYLIEKICNKSYSTVLLERIISPLGLLNTFYGDSSASKNNLALPYKFINNWQLQPQTDLSIPGASGGIVSTPNDLLIFIQALFSKKMVNESSLTHMTTVTNGYGMGFLEFEFHNKKALGYTGGIDEYESVLAYFPEDSLAVAYCSNGHAYPTRSIVVGAMNIFFGKNYSIPDFETYALKKAILKKYTGEYASSEIPVRIKIIRKKQILVAEPTGYSSYPLVTVGRNKFKNDEASVTLEFNLKNNSMTLQRDNRSYTFVKNKYPALYHNQPERLKK